ncbi:MAG: hypothetical protein H7Y13_03025 [Sphingobacteriaceae bacterium]|nr:hypothetical protein [Sphingobacteriaceae bacterium]
MNKLLLITFLSLTGILAFAQVPNITYSSPQVYSTGTAITPLTPANTGGAVPATVYGQVSTFAGDGLSGTTDGAGTSARFYSWGKQQNRHFYKVT